ncbi:sulfotransferase 6B1 [Carcharodon carcharias]|uniref:sulfotransferase 6B1 n=1 Tax=Carcharodon carcharias TaxID=13397 RepID=UPI001B7EECE4|nr:sulfotransferase 6B1 [Carcharodon carcharias]
MERKDSEVAKVKAGDPNTFQGRLAEMLERASNLQPEDMMFRYKGVQYPTVLTSVENLQALPTFEARPEDMLTCSYPKCGFNWVNQLLGDIASASQNESKDWKAGPSKVKLLEFENSERLELMKSDPSPRVYGTHTHYDNLPPSIFEQKTKMLVVFRNPKDNAVSYYHFHQNNPLLPNFVSWDEFFKKYMTGEVGWGSYFDYALVWEKYIDNENVMIITYEELKENLAGGIRKIVEFFNLSLSDEDIQLVAKRGTFQAMSDNSHVTHSTFGKVIFRKGMVGDWRNLFTEEQSQEMDAKFEACLAGTKLGLKLKYDLYC